jgi:hypothetical protein
VAIMYTPHPAQSRLTAFVPSSLVRAAQNDVTVKFSELLEMRRVIEQMAGDLQAARPDLVPFFATGGIPFMIPVMHVLYDRKNYSLVDGRHFHMFPGLSWDGKLDGVDSETYFATEFGRLIIGATHGDGSVRIWTMDATFTGNAIRKLLTALHRTFHELPTPKPKASVSLLAVIDASRAHRKPKEESVPLHSPLGTFYLKNPAEFSPVGDLNDRQPVRFSRNAGDDLFDLTVEYRVVTTIPTEDRYELIGAIAKKETLCVAPNHQVGRLTVEYDNGQSESGTGGNGIGSNILTYLGNTEDRLPWRQWLNVAALPQVSEHERENYEETKVLSHAGLRVFELLGAPTEEALEGLLEQRGLLDGVEVYCLKEHALQNFKENGGALPTEFRDKLLRKVLASARADASAVADALDLFRVCRLDKVSGEPYQQSDQELLAWWNTQFGRD